MRPVFVQKNHMLTFSGSRQECVVTTVLPAQLKTSSDSAEVGQHLFCKWYKPTEMSLMYSPKFHHHHEIDKAYFSIAVVYSFLLTKKQAA